MTELKPCPFAKPGEDHHIEIVTAMGESWGLCSCGATGPTFSGVDSERKAIEAWNTRVERTCKNRGSHMGCSECGWYLNENARYCDGCGAKVVE